MRIEEIFDKDQKTKITLEIMNSLPKWFSPPEDIEKKSIIHREYPLFAVFDAEKCIGFCALKIHNKYTADIYNIGILEEYHSKGIGTELMNSVVKFCDKNNYIYLTVKTLDESADYEPYNITRRFYEKSGFVPLEVFKTFWNEENPCLFMVKKIK